ncbi:hypothetical protein QBZ16_002105 [Prototheca wickerhamii]|uniref:Uncharacterized protein n=1 Tax=Prototheca wickerhamii TaxID=3111 RepID=A0AAD9MLH1_PROWI|nr:hypothetical protein QBZ16_002105 [Prototheca wickerhamii]
MLRGGLTRRSARYVLVAPFMVAALLLVSSSSYQATRWIPIERGLRPDATGPPSTLPPALSSEASGTGKVALLFLTMGQMPHAETWRLWMASAAGKLPKVNVYCNPNVDVVQEACQGLTPLEAASLPPEDVLAWQHLYSVYVHAAPSVNVSSIPPLFRKHLIETRVETQWGSISLVYAARLLIWEAFVHLSPSDIPLYDPVTFHYQLMSESLSRTSACVSTSLDLYRWNSAMTVRRVGSLPVAASHVQQRASTRSSPLLFMLTREHAGLVLDDTHIFQQYVSL